MPPRSAAALLLAALAATAGCSAVFGPSSPTPTTSPTPAGTPSPAGTQTPTSTPVTPPPGLTATGVADPVVFARTHTASLSNRSFTMRYAESVYAENGSEIGESRRVARVGAGGRRYAYRLTIDGSMRRDNVIALTREREWSNGSVTVVSNSWANGTTYERFEDHRRTVPAVTLGAKSIVFTAFSGVDVRVASVERVDGTVVYNLTAGEGPHDVGRNVSFSARVEASGLVRSMRLSYVTERDGRTVRVVQRLRFEDLGTTTVPRPEWVDRAMRETARDGDAA